ncbi:MAG: lytic transglycosylase domain-containing protein [Verrucomicrobiota bacterium]|nr:lytic transglycosylase domain-containing protein [Verrucomicrobiota bacterium]MDD8047409.1 lytic transglycosylase domain-containing protein [Verrucomicrobiota bacterium]
MASKRYIYWAGAFMVWIAGVHAVRSMEVSELDDQISWSLVAAISEIESGYDASAIGSHGERGLMQIKRATWDAVAPKVYGRRLPFQKAFEPADNLRVGKAYLHELASFLSEHSDAWNGDPLDLLIAAYNTGPSRLLQVGFSLEECSPATQSYVRRVQAVLKEMLYEDQAFLSE